MAARTGALDGPPPERPGGVRSGEGDVASPMGGSGGEDASGVIAETRDRPLDKATSRFGGDTAAPAHLAIAALAPVDETKPTLDRVPERGGVERAEQLVEHDALGCGDHGLLGADHVDQVAERAVTVLADRTVEGDRCRQPVETGVLVVELVAVAETWRKAARRLAERSPGSRTRLAFWSSACPMA